MGIRPQGRVGREGHTGTRFTCFTSTKVVVLTCGAAAGVPAVSGALTRFTCFTSTKLVVLTPAELLQGFQQSQARYGRSVNGGCVLASVGGV